MNKLTSWQRLARIAFKYNIRTHGYDVPEIAANILRHKDVTASDKRRVEKITEEWVRAGNGH